MKRLFSRLNENGRQALILIGVNGIFWFAWAFGCYQTVYLQSIGFTASSIGLLNAIASAVLGGTSMAGGIGTIGGTIVGAFVIGVINDGMVMCGVSEFWQMVIKGMVIVLAVIIDQFQRNLQAKMALKARNESK